MSHIFISYSRQDQAYARQLAEDIRIHGFDVWIDDRIDYGDRWWLTIVKAIEDCAAFVVVMSPDAEKSEWVEREILLAQRDHKNIFPILLEGRVFALLITTQFADVQDGSLPKEDFYRRLARIIEPTRGEGVVITPNTANPEPQKARFSLSWLAAAGILIVVLGVATAYRVGLLPPGGTTTKTPTYTDEPPVTSTPTITPSPTPTNTPDPRPGFTPVIYNRTWTPFEQDFAGVTMILVPVGCFMMGDDAESNDEKPAHEQCFQEPFWLDKYEVTNAQYSSMPSGTCANYSSEPDQPRNCVDWFEAQAFCEARGGRLPTEAEWEYAARGPDSLIYPWGNNFVARNLVYINTSGGTTARVDSRSGGVSWVGAQNMSGNVWEWTSSQYEAYPFNVRNESAIDPNDSSIRRVLRGGSFQDSASSARSANRYQLIPNVVTDLSLGFRCARDYTP